MKVSGSARSALVGGLGLGLGGGLATWLIFRLRAAPVIGLDAALVGALIYGLAYGLGIGLAGWPYSGGASYLYHKALCAFLRRRQSDTG
jgi:hypothetical protein